MVERLRDGDSIIIAEGFMWECERRGYLSLGAFIPEVILENPGLVKGIHEEYVHAGTDVVEAFTVCLLNYIITLIAKNSYKSSRTTIFHHIKIIF